MQAASNGQAKGAPERQIVESLWTCHSTLADTSASQIGMLVGGRSLLAVFLSLHVGVLMDRFGTRRVTLFFVWTAMALTKL